MDGMFEFGTGISFLRNPRDDSFVCKVMCMCVCVSVCMRVRLYTMTVLYDVTFVQVSEQIPLGDGCGGCGSYTFVCYESRQGTKIGLKVSVED
jgi:hypothetical protein